VIEIGDSEAMIDEMIDEEEEKEDEELGTKILLLLLLRNIKIIAGILVPPLILHCRQVYMIPFIANRVKV
jgi:hypothetical protein